MRHAGAFVMHPYASEEYILGLTHIGRPFAVPEWGSYVLVRAIPGGRGYDVTGAYPLAVLSEGADLVAGLARLAAAGFVSVVLVADDRLRPPLSSMEAAFNMVRPFKSHYLYLKEKSAAPAYSKHHRYEIKRALGSVQVSEIDLKGYLPEWQALYSELAARHDVGSLHAFPSQHHEAMARLPGLRTFGAFVDGRLVCAHLFVTHEGYAFSHLAASAREGYETGAAYAVNDFALRKLSDCDVVNFGGTAGREDDPANGLARFKRGFSNATASSYLCGAVLDCKAYQTLSATSDDIGFFPAYRGPKLQG